MCCDGIELTIPDFVLGELSRYRQDRLIKHLADCQSCQKWLEVWIDICHFSRNLLLLPNTLDWYPFYKALRQHLNNPTDDLKKPFLIESMSIPLKISNIPFALIKKSGLD
jgi:hypothetical protein